MKNTSPPNHDHDPHIARLQYFLTWIIGFAFLFTVLEGAVGIIFRSLPLSIAGLVSAGCLGSFIVAYRMAGRGQIERTVLLFTGTLLSATLIGVLVWNLILPTIAMLPLIVVAVALPYLSGRRLQRLMIACWLVLVVVTVVGELVPSHSTLPQEITSAFRVSTFVTCVTLFLLLLWQFSNRLQNALGELRYANQVLQYQEAVQRLLSEASMLLLSSFHYETSLPRMVQQIVPMLGDWCSVELWEDQQVRRIAVAGPEQFAEAVLQDAQRQNSPGWHSVPVARRALQKGHPLLLYSPRAAPDQAIQSSMVIPIVARGQTLGVMTVATSQADRSYRLEDLDLAGKLALRMALAIDNARLYATTQEAIHIRDQFLSIASHELKTPLMPLLMYTELLQRPATQEALSAREQRAVHVIQEQARRLNKLIESLLDLSRIQTGRLTIDLQTIDLVALVRRVVALMQPMTQQHTIEAVCQHEVMLIEGDELRLEQVLQNLLQNAIKYSPDGGPIRVELGSQDRHASIAVTDHGIGIPQAAQAYLFERFYRAQNVNPQQIAGFGIGLYVVREIITMHGGSVNITSTEGSGTTVSVYLPLSQPARSRDPVSGTP